MKKVFILSVLVLSGIIAFAQKAEVNSEDLPISKKAKKFGQYGGSYWDSKGETLQTFYTYREKRNSPRSVDVVDITLDGKVSGPTTEDFTLDNLAKYDVQIDPTISEEDDFINFNQPMVWFKRVDLGLNGIAFDGSFEAVYDDFGFVGYEFEKDSKKTLLMGEENQSLNLDFVLAEGPIVEKYSSKVLSRGFMGLSTLATYAYVPKGEKVVVGGVMNGRVKIGLNASPDWLRTRFLIGTYDTKSMSWIDQKFVEFEHTMTSLATLKTEDGVVVLLRKDSKGTLENNRVHFKNSEYEGIVMLEIDKQGNLKSQIEIDNGDFNFPPLQGMANVIDPTFEIRKVGSAYFITGVGFGKGTQFEALHIYKVANGKVSFAQKLSAEDLNDFQTAKGEKVKELIKKKEVPEINDILAFENELLILGNIKEVGNFLLRLDPNSGSKKQFIATAAWTPKKPVTIPLGVRGWSKTKSSSSGVDLLDYPVTVEQQGDWYYILYRKMNEGMTPGSTISSSSSSSNGVIRTTYTKSVKIDEVFAFGKLLMINKSTGAIVDPVMIDDEILVGYYGMYLGKDGKAFLHGYDGKNYKITTVTVK
ncbi:MAG: hypothetical protein CMP48_17855 [Rickettsiales bacterium]|nr:hypothetical protein [Rickettsiales bacterium]